MKKISYIIKQIVIILSLLIFIWPVIASIIFTSDMLIKMEDLFQGETGRASYFGIGLLFTYVGVNVLRKKEVDIEYLNSSEVMYTITGIKALAFGAVFLISGLAALLWGGVIWVRYVIPKVLSTYI